MSCRGALVPQRRKAFTWGRKVECTGLDDECTGLDDEGTGLGDEVEGKATDTMFQVSMTGRKREPLTEVVMGQVNVPI